MAIAPSIRSIRIRRASDGVVVAEATEAPFTPRWEDVPEGSHEVYAEVMTVSGLTYVSAPKTVGDVASNEAPTVSASLPDVSGDEGDASVVVNLDDHFSDPNDDALTYSLIGSPSSAALSGTRSRILTISRSSGVSETVTVRATDSASLYVQDAFTVNVAAASPPVNIINSTFDGSAGVDVADYVGGNGEEWYNAHYPLSPGTCVLTGSGEVRAETTLFTMYGVKNPGSFFRPHWIKFDGMELSAGGRCGPVWRRDWNNQYGYSASYYRTTDSKELVIVQNGGQGSFPLVEYYDVEPRSDDTYTIWVHDKGTSMDIYWENDDGRSLLRTINSPAYGNLWEFGFLQEARPTAAIGTGQLILGMRTSVNDLYAGNAAPTVSAPLPNVSGGVGAASVVFDLDAYFSDPDADALTYSIVGTSSSASLSGTRNKTLTVSRGSAVSENVTIRATDPGGLTVNDTFSVNVTIGGGQNEAPTVSVPLSDVTGVAGAGSVVVDLDTKFSDPDGDALTFTIVSSTSSCVLSNARGHTLTVSRGSAVSETVTIRATDPEGLFVSDTFTVNVTASASFYVDSDFAGTIGTALASYAGNQGEAWTAEQSGTMILTGAGRARPESTANTEYSVDSVPADNVHWIRCQGRSMSATGTLAILARSDFASGDRYRIAYNRDLGNLYVIRDIARAAQTPSAYAVSRGADETYAIWLEDTGSTIRVYWEADGVRTLKHTIATPQFSTQFDVGILCNSGTIGASSGQHIEEFAVGAADFFS